MAASTISVLTSVVSDITCIISDIDGAITHYATSLRKLGYEKLESEPPSWRQEDEKYEDEIDRLFWQCYPPSFRSERFASIPCQYWRHTESGRVVKTYELYNLSLTGAVISENTILLMELLQCKSFLFRGLRDITAPRQTNDTILRKPVVCCLITGARTSTFIHRRHGGSLPQTTFESCEGGSKLWCRLLNPSKWFKDQAADVSAVTKPGEESPFYPSKADVPMDVEWTNKFSGVTGFCAGKSEKENIHQRESTKNIWELEMELNKAGFTTDHKHYDTSFLIDISNSPCVRSSLSHNPSTAAKFNVLFDNTIDAEKYLVMQFRETYNNLFNVELFINLGKGQVNARGSGKRGVMLRVLDRAAEMDSQANHTPGGIKSRFSVEHTVALFDDENDLQFGALCGAAILPSIAHEEVLSHKQWRSDLRERKWFRPPIEGLLGSEWALKQIILFKRQGAVCD